MLFFVEAYSDRESVQNVSAQIIGSPDEVGCVIKFFAGGESTQKAMHGDALVSYAWHFCVFTAGDSISAHNRGRVGCIW